MEWWDLHREGSLAGPIGGFRIFGGQALGLWSGGLGFRGLGFRGLWFRGLGFRVSRLAV